ncbi:hypothetical protein INT45_013764 [Circinella minor]|uniref:Uncharacterized protein n=1 Tax=Circinella minor TaxID=1195481 RepID=A0A8H7RKL7_9FUNG|nr:hypothetical protein INT45_013764 [Circinella minor]
MTVPRANKQPQPTSQALHQHPGASFAQLMNQPMYHPFGPTLSPSSEAIIMGRLDSIQGEMTSISQAIRQQDVASGQDRAKSDDEADELPLDFMRQPRTTTGKVRNSTKSDVEAAILALVDGNVKEQQKKLASIDKYVDTAIGRIKMMVLRNKVPHSWTSQDWSVRDAIIKLLLDSVSKSHPFIPLDACEKSWIAHYFLVQKWNNIHTRDDDEESMVVTNES